MTEEMKKIVDDFAAQNFEEGWKLGFRTALATLDYEISKERIDEIYSKLQEKMAEINKGKES